MRSTFSTLFLAATVICLQAMPAAADYSVIDKANAAIKAHQHKDLPRAFALYTEVINANALDNGDHLLMYIYNNRGQIYLTRNEPNAAIKDFSQSIANVPDYVTYINRGNAYTMLGQDRQAIDDFTAALNLRPTAARAYASRAFAWMNLGNMANARQDMARARQLDPMIDVKSMQ